MHRRTILVTASLLVGSAGLAVPAVASAHGAGKTACTGTLAAGTYQDVQVKTGQTCAIDATVTISHDLKMDGGTLVDTGATIRHDVHVHGAASVSITGGTVSHDIKIEKHTAAVSVSGATVGHDIQFESTTGAASVVGATVGHDAKVTGGAGVTISGTSVAHDLKVTSSSGAVTVSTNTVSGKITVTDSTPGGATIQDNTDHSCDQHNNHPYLGSGNAAAGSCNTSNV